MKKYFLIIFVIAQAAAHGASYSSFVELGTDLKLYVLGDGKTHAATQIRACGLRARVKVEGKEEPYDGTPTRLFVLGMHNVGDPHVALVAPSFVCDSENLFFRPHWSPNDLVWMGKVSKDLEVSLLPDEASAFYTKTVYSPELGKELGLPEGSYFKELAILLKKNPNN